jgi:DNA-binding GntR family transcriptional regulator
MARDVSISRSVLSDQVKGRLLEAILDGRLPPGARIVETRVAREFGTSQAPVREALRDLEALGVVESTAFRGARVRHPSAAELLEAFAVRSILETFAARSAVVRMSQSEFERLEGFLDEMRRAAADGDPYREATADAAFHGLIVRMAGNVTLERVWRTLEPFLRTYISIATPGMDRRAVADRHAPVLEALRSRDPERVVAALEEHFERAAEALAGRWPEPERADETGGARAASGVGAASG